MKTLGGVLFVREGKRFDYCTEEALESLVAVCDEVVVLEIGNNDDNFDLEDEYDDVMYVRLNSGEWHSRSGRERISYFQNAAKNFLSTDYYFLLQADEILDENSHWHIHAAMEKGEEAYYCKRINLWR